MLFYILQQHFPHPHTQAPIGDLFWPEEVEKIEDRALKAQLPAAHWRKNGRPLEIRLSSSILPKNSLSTFIEQFITLYPSAICRLTPCSLIIFRHGEIFEVVFGAKGNDGIFYIVEFRCGVYNIISKIAPSSSPSILSTIKPMTLWANR